MSEKKTIGQIASDAAGSPTLSGYITEEAWEAAASAVWDKAIEECIYKMEIEFINTDHISTAKHREQMERYKEAFHSLKRSPSPTEETDG